jgi:hypothetical protein
MEGDDRMTTGKKKLKKQVIMLAASELGFEKP